MTSDTTLIFNDPALLISVLVNFVVPTLVALFTKSSASSGVKAIVNLVFVSVTSALGTLWGDDCGCWQWALFAQNFILGFIMSTAGYYSLWRPTKISAAITNATPRFGVGSPPDLEVDADSERGEESVGTAVRILLGILLVLLIVFLAQRIF